MKKLVIVTVRFRGKVNQKMVNATVTNGRASVPESLITDMARELGAPDHSTIQIG